MRVTANMSADISLYNIQQGRNRIDKLVEKLTANQKIIRPSDDPVASGVLLDINDKTKAYNQFGNNITKAKTWLEFTNNGLNGISGILDSTRQMTTGAPSLSQINDPTERQMAHDQLVEFKKQLIEMANIKFGDQYIFGGGNNLVPPFSQKSGDLTSGLPDVYVTDVAGLTTGMQVSGTGISAGTVISAITAGPPSSITLSNAATTTTTGSKLNFYAGDGTQREVEITTNTRQTISTTGDRLLLGSTVDSSPPNYGTSNVLQAFDDLIAAVGDFNNPSNPTAVTTAARALEPAAKQVFAAITANIARIHRVDNMAALNDLNKITLTNIADNIQNVDLVKYGMQLNIEKTAFEASLASTAKVSQMSLLNYL
ncbi:MAG: hypothetical protein ACOYL3_19205 [Desulfuromonadaceae bacterium]